MRQKIFICALVLCGLISVSAHAFKTTAKQAILIDAQTGKVLFEKNADQLMYPSSMTKIMTVYMLFEQLKMGRVSLDDMFPVSKAAWRKKGSRMFVEVDSLVRVEDLLRGIIVQSGNDASIVVAEGLTGSEAVFATEMSRRAHELGATKTTFKNATGWPDPLHVTTARDLALISDKLIRNFPDLYNTYFGQTEFTFNNIRQINRNPLLYRNIGADGIKTGQTDKGGFGIVASAVQNGRRLILVVNGLKTKGERARQSEALMRWGVRNFLTPKIFKGQEEVVKANVWLGAKPSVSLVLDQDLYVTVPRYKAKDMKVQVTYQEPIAAPVRAGQEVGRVTVHCPDEEPFDVPLRVSHDVGKAGFFERIRAACYYLFWGHNER